MTASPLRPRIQQQESGITARGRLALRGTPYDASLSFATTTHLRPPSDPPSRKPRSAKPGRTGTARSIPGRALAFDVGFPLSGSRTGLPPPISTSVPGTPPLAPRGSLRCEPARAPPNACPHPALPSSVRALSYADTVNSERVHGTGGGPDPRCCSITAGSEQTSTHRSGRPATRLVVRESSVELMIEHSLPSSRSAHAAHGTACLSQVGCRGVTG